MSLEKKRVKRDFVEDITMPDSLINEITNDVADVIFSHLEDSRHIAIARCVCKVFNEAGKNVLSLRCVARAIDHENARKHKGNIIAKTFEEEYIRGEILGSGLRDDLRDDTRSQATTPPGDVDADQDGGPHSPRELENVQASQELESWTRERTHDAPEVHDVSTGVRRTGEGSRNCLNPDRFKHDGAAQQSSDSENARERARANHVRNGSQRTSENPEFDHKGYTSSSSSSLEGIVVHNSSLNCERNGNGIFERNLGHRVAHGDQEISHQQIVGDNPKSAHKGEDDDMTKALQDESSTITQKAACEGCQTKQKQQLKQYTPFRQVLEHDLRSKRCLIQLRIEIDPKLQSKSVPAEERRECDLWLSDPLHLIKWVPSVGKTLQHLCIVDYGIQAIMRKSSILKILSQHCKRLKTIDLRNMLIDAKDCEPMPELTSFTLRCVKMNGDALDDITNKMENLQTLALLGVFGIQTGCLRSPQLKVLCLGLSTKAGAIKLDLPNLSKLQLKMACPEELCISAPILKFVAFNLEVYKYSEISFSNMSNLQELLYGASNFLALSKLVKGNWFLNKLFLDIPCMALGEDGKWLGALKDVMLNIPSFETLQVQCPNLAILNIGPGLWHSMETNIEEVKKLKRWPPVKTLILHMIPQMLATSVTLLNKLRTEMHETLINLEINIHTSSPVASIEFIKTIQDSVRELNFKWKPWTKSLDFSCFTF
ncbi:hypothetical protein BDL97_08G066300 [Sphagnum fallax]|nr:hypothetical protein BDL97_08G066300 [Sphagnum fallax]KAH8954187.1 hypothetical protein BDL97_08G066300 [Sphagnum fallax]